MTRTTNRALVTLFVGLFSLAQAVGVGAHECADGIDNRCAPSMTVTSIAHDDLVVQQDAFIADSANVANLRPEMQATLAQT